MRPVDIKSCLIIPSLAKTDNATGIINSPKPARRRHKVISGTASMVVKIKS